MKNTMLHAKAMQSDSDDGDNKSMNKLAHNTSIDSFAGNDSREEEE